MAYDEEKLVRVLESVGVSRICASRERVYEIMPEQVAGVMDSHSERKCQRFLAGPVLLRKGVDGVDELLEPVSDAHARLCVVRMYVRLSGQHVRIEVRPQRAGAECLRILFQGSQELRGHRIVCAVDRDISVLYLIEQQI